MSASSLPPPAAPGGPEAVGGAGAPSGVAPRGSSTLIPWRSVPELEPGGAVPGASEPEAVAGAAGCSGAGTSAEASAQELILSSAAALRPTAADWTIMGASAEAALGPTSAGGAIICCVPTPAPALGPSACEGATSSGWITKSNSSATSSAEAIAGPPRRGPETLRTRGARRSVRMGRFPIRLGSLVRA